MCKKTTKPYTQITLTHTHNDVIIKLKFNNVMENKIFRTDIFQQTNDTVYTQEKRST